MKLVLFERNYDYPNVKWDARDRLLECSQNPLS